PLRLRDVVRRLHGDDLPHRGGHEDPPGGDLPVHGVEPRPDRLRRLGGADRHGGGGDARDRALRRPRPLPRHPMTPRGGRYWANLLRHIFRTISPLASPSAAARTATLLGRQRRSTYREYAGQSWLPRASSGSQLDPVPRPN